MELWDQPVRPLDTFLISNFNAYVLSTSPDGAASFRSRAEPTPIFSASGGSLELLLACSFHNCNGGQLMYTLLMSLPLSTVTWSPPFFEPRWGQVRVSLAVARLPKRVKATGQIHTCHEISLGVVIEGAVGSGDQSRIVCVVGERVLVEYPIRY